MKKTHFHCTGTDSVRLGFSRESVRRRISKIAEYQRRWHDRLIDEEEGQTVVIMTSVCRLRYLPIWIGRLEAWIKHREQQP